MNNTNTPSEIFLNSDKNKDTNICAFLKVVPHLKAVSQQSIYKLAERFTINPELLTLLISIAVNGGTYYEN